MVSTELTALLSPLDEDDDSVLPIVADWLEDKGVYVREALLYHKPRYTQSAEGWAWYNVAGGMNPKGPDDLPEEVFARLTGRPYDRHAKVYNKRSDAFRGLILALSEGVGQ
jgi:hypothetical protein